MEPDLWHTALKTAGMFVFLVCLIIALLFLFRRLRYGSRPGGAAVQIRLVGMLRLTPKHTVSVVEVGDQWLVLGMGTETVTLLSKMEPVRGARDAKEHGGQNIEH